MLSRYNRIIENFKIWYPNLYDQTVDCMPSGYESIVATLRDGTKIEYCDRDHTFNTVTKFYERDSDTEIDEEAWRKEFGIKLRHAISDRGINQERLSDLTGISKQMLTRYVRGMSTPSAYNLSRLAEILKCDIRELCTFGYIED